MPFSIRPFRRFPVCCPVTYQCGLFEGHGIAWNLSLTGWRFSGNLPLRIGDVCSLTVNLPTQETLSVVAGIVHGYVVKSTGWNRSWWTTHHGRIWNSTSASG